MGGYVKAWTNEPIGVECSNCGDQLYACDECKGEFVPDDIVYCLENDII